MMDKTFIEQMLFLFLRLTTAFMDVQLIVF